MSPHDVSRVFSYACAGIIVFIAGIIPRQIFGLFAWAFMALLVSMLVIFELRIARTLTDRQAARATAVVVVLLCLLANPWEIFTVIACVIAVPLLVTTERWWAAALLAAAMFEGAGLLSVPFPDWDDPTSFAIASPPYITAAALFVHAVASWSWFTRRTS